jgi:hypothetical protein
MFAVDWETILSNFIAVPTLFDQALRSIMAALAQRLDLAEAKRIPVSSVRLNVVDDGGRYDKASVCTHGTEGMLAELMVGDSLPTGQSIPIPPSPIRRTRLSTPTATDAAHQLPLQEIRNIWNALAITGRLPLRYRRVATQALKGIIRRSVCTRMACRGEIAPTCAWSAGVTPFTENGAISSIPDSRPKWLAAMFACSLIYIHSSENTDCSRKLTRRDCDKKRARRLR